jgi:hypothetical protein
MEKRTDGIIRHYSCFEYAIPPARFKQNRIRTTVVFYGLRSFESKTAQADAKETASSRAAFVS